MVVDEFSFVREGNELQLAASLLLYRNVIMVRITENVYFSSRHISKVEWIMVNNIQHSTREDQELLNNNSS